MKIHTLIALLVAVSLCAKVNWWQKKQAPNATPMLSMFYCGFGGDYCGQSSTNDVNSATTNVILAFVNSNADGSVSIDAANFPKSQYDIWKSQGKNVLISVGGQNGNWAYIFASDASITAFTNSLVKIVADFNLDGVDLDI